MLRKTQQISLSQTQAGISSPVSFLKSKGDSLEEFVTLNTPFEEGFAALTGPDPVVVPGGVVVADSAVPRLLGGLHGQAPLLAGTGHPLPDAVAPGIRAGSAGSRKNQKNKKTSIVLSRRSSFIRCFRL